MWQFLISLLLIYSIGNTKLVKEDLGIMKNILASLTTALVVSVFFGTMQVSAMSLNQDTPVMEAYVEQTEQIDYYLEDELLDLALYSESDEADYAELEALAYELSDDEMDDIAYDVEAYDEQEQLAYELSDDEMDDIAYDVDANDEQELIVNELSDDEIDDIICGTYEEDSILG